MTNEELDLLEALAKKATPGPWHASGYAVKRFEASAVERVAMASDILGFRDASFIAAASPDVVLRLVAEIRNERHERNANAVAMAQAVQRSDRIAAELSEARAEIERLTVARDDALSGEHDAVRRAESAEIGCQIAYRREPTQEEGDAHGYDLADGAIPECHVPMGNHHGHRCRCGQWVWNGPTVCRRCVDADAVKIAIEWKAEAERLRKIFSDAGHGEHDVLALIDHYQDEARRSHEARCEACESSATEIERLRAMVPSGEYACFCCRDVLVPEVPLCEQCIHGCDEDEFHLGKIAIDRERCRLEREQDQRLARIESAKENGR